MKLARGDAGWVALLLGQLGLLLGWALAGVWWPLDLLNHLPWLWAVAAGLGVATSLRRPGVAAFFAVLVAAHALRWAAPSLRDGGRPGTQAVRVVVANVYTGNRDHQSIVDLARTESADLVALMEVDERWIADLGALRKDWPHHLEVPRSDNFGVALYARQPIDARVVQLGTVPSIEAELLGVPLLLTHPLPPVSSEYAAARDAQLLQISQWMAVHADRFVVLGDLNATPWSWRFPGRAVGGMMWGTWPAGWPGFLRIPIDHVLTGPEIELRQRRVGPDIGSDHRPIVADLTW